MGLIDYNGSTGGLPFDSRTVSVEAIPAVSVSVGLTLRFFLSASIDTRTTEPPTRAAVPKMRTVLTASTASFTSCVALTPMRAPSALPISNAATIGMYFTGGVAVHGVQVAMSLAQATIRNRQLTGLQLVTAFHRLQSSQRLLERHEIPIYSYHLY